MKRIVLIVAILYAMSLCGSVAYADNTAAYTGGSVNEAKITDTGNYSTVLITKASDDPITDSSIVYVDQTDRFFDAIMDFMLKENPSVGKYNVKLGRWDGTTATTTFYIGVNSNKGSAVDTPMTRLSYTAETTEGNTKYYTAGFSIAPDISDYSSYKTLKVGYKKGDDYIYGGFDLDKHWNPAVLSGEGSIMLVFVLDHITEDELPTVSVFLSKEELASGSAYR